MKKLYTILSVFLIGGLLTTNLLGQVITSNGTGGGEWNSGATWIGGAIPSSSNDVVIQGSDAVTLTTTAGTCAKLTMNAGTSLSINTAALSIPGTSWDLNITSTVAFNVPTTVQSGPVYGNLTYGSANGGPNGDLTVNGNLNVTTNTFRAITTASGSRTITIGGNLNIGPGTSARISAVTTSSNNTASSVWNIAGNVNMTGNNSGNRITFYESGGAPATASTININGDLTIGASSQISLNSSTGTSVSYPEGIINLKGNLIQNGAFSVQSVTSGSGNGLTLNFVGTSNQAWSGTGTFTPRTGFPINFKVNNSAGVTLSAPKTMILNMAIYLVNGNLTTTSTNLLTINGGTLNGGSATSFINGPVALAATASATLMAPIGKVAAYRPITATLGSLSGSGTLTIEQIEGPTTGTVTATGTPVLSARRHFHIAQTGLSSANVDLTLSWGSDDGILDPTTLTIVGSSDGGITWPYARQAPYISYTGGPTAGTVTASSFSLTSLPSGDCTIGSFSGNPMPVSLSSFTANASNGVMKLSWKTAVETENHGFNVERSTDKSVWATLAFIQGQGNSNNSKAYAYSDNSISKAGKYYYRLKQIDNNGSFTYSNIAEANFVLPTVYSLNQNYPNPFNPNTMISYSLPVASNVKISVYNAIGETVQILENGFKSAGNYSVSFNASNVPSGIYFYRIDAGTFTQVRKMMLLK